MKNLGVIFALCGILAVSNLSAQENNGAFVGFEVGVGNSTLKFDGTDLLGAIWDDKFTATAASYGGKVGYKFFFTDWIGLRAYFGLNYAETMIKQSGNKGTISAFTYGANIDALFNFYNDGSVNYGAFVGLGLGGQNGETDNVVFSATNADNTLVSRSTGNESISGFYMDFKLGLRASAEHSGVEFIVTIPFLEPKKTFNGVEAKLKQDYRISLAYTYSF